LLYSSRLLKVCEKRERGQEETQNRGSPDESIYKSSALIEIICGVFVAGWNFWGQTLGRQVADFVVDHFLGAVHERDDDR